MDFDYAKVMKEEHDKLHKSYNHGLAFALALLLIYLLVCSYLIAFRFIELNIHPWFIVVFVGGGIVGASLIGILMPYRFRRLQTKLLLRSFVEGEKYRLKLIPNLKGGQNFDYPTLLKEASIKTEMNVNVFSRYEYKKRLVHVLYDRENENPYAIMHFPNMNSPYYLQINNDNFAPPHVYKDSRVDKVAFVSANRLNYYATNGPTNVKVYLRRELETRFNAILRLRPGTYQLVATYTDVFLLIGNFDGSRPLLLAKDYSLDYYSERLHNLLFIQELMNIIMEEVV